jgi:tyrosinase
MPYWDWTLDRTMPQAFTDATYNGQTNPLYVPGRTLTNPRRWPLPDSIVGPDVMKKVYSQTTYQAFGTSKNPAQNSLDMSWVVAGGGVQGPLEFTPHNNVHNFIGAFMPTAGSPRDPIFMMHHGNIDRIWAYWNALGRKNSDGMSDQDWTLWSQMSFTNNYLTPTGNPYTVVVKDVQSTIALGYTYGGLPQHDNLREDPERTRRLLSLFATASGVQQLDNLHVLTSPNRQAARLTRPLIKEVRLHPNLRAMVADDNRAPAQDAEVFALIKDIQAGPAVSGLRVFVNAQNPSASTPDSDPHFVTEVGFFAHPPGHGNHHKGLPSVVVDLTDALRRLAKLGKLQDDRITVQLLPSLREGAKDGDAAAVVPAVVEIAAL